MVTKHAIAHAAEFYQERGLDFSKDLTYYLRYGVVVSTPDRFLLAKPARVACPLDYVDVSEADAWFVHFAWGKGALQKLLADAPRFLPWICFHRDKDSIENKSQRLHIIPTTRFTSLVWPRK